MRRLQRDGPGAATLPSARGIDVDGAWQSTRTDRRWDGNSSPGQLSSSSSPAAPSNVAVAKYGALDFYLAWKRASPAVT